MSTSARTLVIALAALALFGASAVAASKWYGKSSGAALNAYSGSGTVQVADSAGRTGTVRAHYLLPRSWKRTSALSQQTLKLKTGNSCGHTVTFTPRLVLAAEAATATDRATELLPASSSYVRAYGTREQAAFRVIRVKGTSTVRGVLVQPLSDRFSEGMPNFHKVYAEINATATADPKKECHSGGPRTVGDAIADSFATAGAAGGFVN